MKKLVIGQVLWLLDGLNDGVGSWMINQLNNEVKRRRLFGE